MPFIKQKFTSILLALVFLVGAISAINFAIKTEAASQTIGDLTVNYPGSPLFNATNIAPGYEEVKTISVTNNGSVEHSFSLALDSANGSLASAIQFETRTLLDDVIWNHTLAEIASSSDGFVIFPKISPGQTAVFKLAAILPATVGNDYQNKSASTFGIIMGSDSSFPYNPPTIPAFGGNDNANQSQGSAPGSNTSTERRLLATDENPTTINDVPVLATNENPQIQSSGSEAMGASASSKIICCWWLILLIIYAIALAVYGWIFNKRELIFDWLWPIFGGVLLYIVHLILHRYYEPSKWCPYFVWIEILLLIIYFIIYSSFKNRKDEE